MSVSNIKILEEETYLKAIENSVGSKQYNSLIAKREDSGKIEDILEDGNLSCAYFVSSLLLLFGKINRQRSTVNGLKNFFGENPNWSQVLVQDAKPGDVVVYCEREFDIGSVHAHVGFVLNDAEAVSTSYKEKAVVKHALDYHPIEHIWRRY